MKTVKNKLRKHPREHMINIEFLCPMCGEFHYLRNIPESKYDRFVRRRENNEAVQDIFPELSKTDREKFLTGYCDECQKKIFRIPDEGEV